MEEGEYSIYILTDPRDRSIRYVGRSMNLELRYKDHLVPAYKTSEEKRQWLLELRALGLKPELQVIDHASNRKEASVKETQWIHRYTDQGSELLNSVCVMQRNWKRKMEERAKAVKEQYQQSE